MGCNWFGLILAMPPTTTKHEWVTELARTVRLVLRLGVPEVAAHS